jgi:uncharacterized protein (DUF2141 family)
MPVRPPHSDVGEEMLSNLRAKGTQLETALAGRQIAPFAQILGSVTTLTAGRALSLSPDGTDDSAFARKQGGFALSDLCRVAIAAAILASILVSILASALGGLAQTAGRLSMTVTGLRSNDGVVRCALHNSPAAFPKAGQEWRGVIAPIRDRQATCVFSGVPAGNYAVAFFHAEHNETQLTPGLFGKPIQGYGFSNNASGSFGPPDFNAAAFRYDGGNLALQASLTY